MNATTLADPIRIRACGKINLMLRVLGKRADGFHEIVSWMQPIDWYDELAIESHDVDEVVLSCHQSDLPTGSDNLICRAIAALARCVGRPPRFRIDLTKRLPLGGGLGGGSSDAAAALWSAARLWSLDPTGREVRSAAEETGSDVAFFLGPGAALARGRGERIEPQPRPFSGWAVLVIPPFGVSTACVYGALHLSAGPEVEMSLRPSDSPWAVAWTSAAQLSARLHNDLTAAALRVEPRLSALYGRLDGVGGARIHMSGSGSTLFALFDDERQARTWQSRVWHRLLTGATAGCALRTVQVLTTPPLCETT